jgi:hypothetical protein
VQVRSGLRQGGFVRAVEAWWGPVVGAEPLPDNYDGPLRAVKLTFSDKTEPVVSPPLGSWSRSGTSKQHLHDSLDNGIALVSLTPVAAVRC